MHGISTKNHVTLQVEMLSYDHKPNNEEELRRITAGGGWVQLNRVNGNLALSRALGDYVFKRNYRLSPQQQIVTGTSSFINMARRTRAWELEGPKVKRL